MQVAASAKLLMLLLLSPTAVAQRTPITNRNIKSVVSDWTTSPRTATTKYGSIGDWNVAAVTYMGYLFYSKPVFNEDLGRWNVASVSNMYCLFSEAEAFDQNIGSWNTAKVSNMNSMFSYAAAFNHDLAAWNTAKVGTMSLMFEQAAAFNQNLAGWNVLSVTSFGGALPRLRHLRRSCTNMPPSLRLVASQPAPRRPEYVFGRAASDVCIRHVPPTEWSLELQAPSPTPSA